jgi:hypothetical protein
MPQTPAPKGPESDAPVFPQFSSGLYGFVAEYGSSAISKASVNWAEVSLLLMFVLAVTVMLYCGIDCPAVVGVPP